MAIRKSLHNEPRETYESKRRWLEMKKQYDEGAQRCLDLMLHPHVSNEQLGDAAASLRKMRKAVVDGSEEIKNLIKREHPDT